MQKNCIGCNHSKLSLNVAGDEWQQVRWKFFEIIHYPVENIPGIPRPVALARHPSLAAQSNANVDAGGFWSRIRSISVTNFAHLTSNHAHVNASAEDLSGNATTTEQDVQSDRDEEATSGGDDCGEPPSWRREMSRCESMPIIDASKWTIDFDTVIEED